METARDLVGLDYRKLSVAQARALVLTNDDAADDHLDALKAAGWKLVLLDRDFDLIPPLKLVPPPGGSGGGTYDGQT